MRSVRFMCKGVIWDCGHWVETLPYLGKGFGVFQAAVEALESVILLYLV
jgi:hypothetical protein